MYKLRTIIVVISIMKKKTLNDSSVVWITGETNI